MKKLAVFFTLCVFASQLYGQVSHGLPVNAQGQIEFSEVFHLEGVSKERIYNACKRFIYSNYKSESITLDDMDIMLSTSNNIPFTCSMISSTEYSMAFNLSLEFKESRCRLQLNQFVFTSPVTSYDAESLFSNQTFRKRNGDLKKPYDCYQSQMLFQVKTLSDNFYKFLVNELNKDSDW
jgi:hypothetical protein